MNDHNLDDLIIDTIAPKSNKTKGLLTITALFIVVLIVAIILTKTLLKSPENAELHFEENLSEIIAPELKLQEPTQVQEIAKPKEEPSLPKIIEEKINVDEEVPEIESSKEVLVTDETKTPKLPEEKIVSEEEKETVAAPEPLEEKSTEKKLQTVKEKSTPPPAKVTKPIIKTSPIPKREEKQPTHKPVVPPTPKPTMAPKASQIPKNTPSGKYFVQVGSFKDNPSRRFLSVIKSSGFQYHITVPDRIGYKKLLIGPYKTREEVDRARDIVRDRIHKSAFVVEK